MLRNIYMDVYSDKRAVGWIAAPRKESGRARRDIACSRDEAAQFCSRLGCSGRPSHMEDTRTKFFERSKSLRPSFRSSYGKEIIHSSPRYCSSVTNVKKSIKESQKKLSSKMVSTNSGRISDESELQKLNSVASGHSKHTSKSGDVESDKAVLVPACRTVEVASSNRNTREVYHKKSVPTNQNVQIGSSDSCRRRSTTKKRSTEGERSSSTREKKINGSSSDEGHGSLSAYGISISDPRQSSIRAASRGSGVSSVRTRRPVNVDISTRCIHQLHGNNPSPVQSTNSIPSMPQTEIRWFAAEVSSNGSSLDGHCTSSDTLSSMTPVASTDHSIAHSTHRNGPGRYNLDGIADVLLALERIEQVEELTYEILLLEANSLLGDFNFYDQHRDMRLDIDNMSYEELLVLEEKIGTVSTALSEEELSKCLGISVYKPLHAKERRTRDGCFLDGTKCSICQEEFIAGDKIGSLGCAHEYHAVCINQWLRLKNWCPVCKASAKPSVS